MKYLRPIIICGGMLVAASFFWHARNTGFEAKSALLVQSEDAQAPATVVAFTKTDQFLQRTLSSTRFQGSVWGSRTADTQKKDLQSHLTVKREKASEVLIVRFFDTNEEGAKVGAKESVETLVRMARAYEPKNGIAIRTLDEPYVTEQRALWMLVLEVVVTALLGTLVLELLIRLGMWIWNNIHKKQKKSETTPEHFIPEKMTGFPFHSEQATPDDFSEVPVLEQEVESEESPETKEDTNAQSGLQSVSVNMEDLPFELEMPGEETKDMHSVAKVQEPVEMPKAKGMPEPSVVEYKRRLNQLLRG